ncbi:hypothetical protein D6855_00410 [Butyrivibrio sp. CB08]|uniref:hypothetical protein n=1 Tax=Butyrivibrio sp. CB08 TaxID=2364879 RepID=UPI000EA941DC|nr:hypothetical protein [Butyrivibrio sp. CB08]RKM61914.1 hypothetical protein D6855_00410 [Butyrivibrio sp. CB08]
MWNFLKGFWKTERPIFSLFKLGWKVWIIIMIVGVLFSMGLVGYIALFFLASHLFNKYEDKLKNGKEMGTVPYWGRIFGLKQTIRLLSADKFKPYVMKDGTTCQKVQVSESGRWFYVNGRYYPTNLVHRFEHANSKLIMINGDSIKNQMWLDDPVVRKALDEILYSKKAFYNYERRNSAIADIQEAFKNVYKGKLPEMSKADWDELRYRWEQELADIEAGKTERSNFNQRMRELETDKGAKKELFGRVLLDQEINIISKAIKDGRIKEIDGWFDISLFRNDICVINGVKLAKCLGYPENASALEFLFQCIKDIQKPYFEEAINTLEQFPEEDVIPLIEKYVTIAHEEGDVLFGAGLLYLSKRIGYEISLKRDSSGDIKLEESESEFEKMVLAQGKM